MLSPQEQFPQIDEIQPLELLSQDSVITDETQKTVINSLVKLTETQTQLTELNENLKTIFKVMEEEKSLFSKAAQTWGGLPLWQKVVGGLLLVVPVGVAGIAANITALLVISGVTSISYTATGLLLSDHDEKNNLVIERLKQTVNSMASILTIVITALENIRLKFEREIERFIAENLKLTQNVTKLTDQVDLLGCEIDELRVTERELRQDKEALEAITESLKTLEETQSEKLKDSERLLAQAQEKFDLSQTKLSEKVEELRFVRTSMEEEIAKVKTLNVVLKDTVKELADYSTAEEEQKKAFEDRLATFISDADKSFIDFTSHMSKTNQELEAVKQKLEATSKVYYDLLERHEQQVVKLENLNTQLFAENATFKRAVGAQFLTQSGGFFANKPGASIPLTLAPILTI